MTVHIMTGATGFVGRHLLADLLADDATTGLYALSRGTAELPAADRVCSALNEVGSVDSSRVTVVDSDLTEELCGVTSDAVTRGDGITIFWHLAASLQWRRGQREQIFRTNVDGTSHALDLAKSIGADLFVYVSTAYTCGSLHGDLAEELHRPPSTSNLYEESKCAAEHLVAEFNGVRTLILRPSVIVGSSVDYKPSGSYTGLYGYLSELRKFKEMLGDSSESVRFHASRATRLSFIPVDHVVEDLRAIVRRELDTPNRSIYHVTGESEVSVGEIMDYMFKLLDLQDRLIISEVPVEDQTILERMFDKRIEFFADYLRNEKRFIRTASPRRVVYGHEVSKYVDAEHTL